ncbi:MAG TPA: hypothetical protein VHV83_10690, partial [Armatimonadota bacterium]|nr:hypothetical protein [Armatimonadota bacterium]
MKRLLMALSAILFLILPVYAADTMPKELLTNGNIEAGTDAPTDWTIRPGVTWEAENGNHHLRLTSPQPGATVTTVRKFLLQPNWGMIRISTRVRYHNIVKGSEDWHTGRIAMNFYDVQGKGVGHGPAVLNWIGTSETWKDASRDYVIPDGAASLMLTFALFNTQSGQIDFDNVSVSVIKTRDQLYVPPSPHNFPINLWQTQTATRGQICLNGYWLFRPLRQPDDIQTLTPAMLTTPPQLSQSAPWALMAVPACWPGQWKDGHQPITPSNWTATNWKEVEAAWYQRDITIPVNWQGRRILVAFEMPQTQVNLFIDGQPIGIIRWPYGEFDVTKQVHPGSKHRLTAFVTALPFSAEKMVAMRDDIVFKAKSVVRFRARVRQYRVYRKYCSQNRQSVMQVRVVFYESMNGIEPTLCDSSSVHYLNIHRPQATKVYYGFCLEYN